MFHLTLTWMQRVHELLCGVTWRNTSNHESGATQKALHGNAVYYEEIKGFRIRKQMFRMRNQLQETEKNGQMESLAFLVALSDKNTIMSGTRWNWGCKVMTPKEPQSQASVPILGTKCLVGLLQKFLCFKIFIFTCCTAALFLPKLNANHNIFCQIIFIFLVFVPSFIFVHKEITVLKIAEGRYHTSLYFY